MSELINLSSLAHLWLIDLDGTILIHNGYKLNGVDSLLPGALDFLNSIPSQDNIIFITTRESKFKDETVNFLNKFKIRYDFIIFDMPVGERIIMNDIKPLGLNTAIAINLNRNSGDFPIIKINENL